jgi:hypothetical protein
MIIVLPPVAYDPFNKNQRTKNPPRWRVLVYFEEYFIAPFSSSLQAKIRQQKVGIRIRNMLTNC